MKKYAMLAYAMAVMMLVAGFSVVASSGVRADNVVEPEMSGHEPPGTAPPTGWNVVTVDTPTGTAYFNFERYGGWWSDAEKSPTDGDDDLLCWAATLSNVMEYTGWGYVGDLDTPDESLDYFGAHVTDEGTTIDLGFKWWLEGDLPDLGDGWASEDVEGGAFWPGYNYFEYVHKSTDMENMMVDIEANLAGNRGTGIWIEGIGGGSHEITVWGVNVQDGVDASDKSRYHGIWVSDSDSHKGDIDAEDFLIYYAVEWDDSNKWWWMPSYSGGWRIIETIGIEIFPGEERPEAEVEVWGTSAEGSELHLLAADSSDPDGDALQYRWDFDGDGIWDTEFDYSAIGSHTWPDDYSGKAYVQVFDGRLADIASVDIVVENVAPTVSIAMDNDIDEDDQASVTLTMTEPGVLDTLKVTLDWGDGSEPVVIDMALGTLTCTLTHDFPDDDPTGTAYDVYSVAVTVVDKDGGTGQDDESLTVRSLAPSVSIYSMHKPNPFFILPMIHEIELFASFTDVGLLDTHSAVWDWGDGATTSESFPGAGGGSLLSAKHTYNEPGTYTVTLTVTDDDTVAGTDTWVVEVSSASDVVIMIDDYIQDIPNSAFSKNPSIAEMRKNALHNMLMDIVEKIDAGWYNSAIQDLLKNIRDKFDGLPIGKTNNDWIKGEPYRTDLCLMVDDLVEYLRLFL